MRTTNIAYADEFRPAMKSATIANNQVAPATLFSYNPTLYPYAFILMSVERGTSKDIYYTQQVSDGVAVSGGLNKNSIGVTGVTITKTVLGGLVTFQYTSTNTGVAGTFKYCFVNRWS